MASLVSNETSSNEEARKFDARPQNMTPGDWGAFKETYFQSLEFRLRGQYGGPIFFSRVSVARNDPQISQREGFYFPETF